MTLNRCMMNEVSSQEPSSAAVATGEEKAGQVGPHERKWYQEEIPWKYVCAWFLASVLGFLVVTSNTDSLVAHYVTTSINLLSLLYLGTRAWHRDRYGSSTRSTTSGVADDSLGRRAEAKEFADDDEDDDGDDVPVSSTQRNRFGIFLVVAEVLLVAATTGLLLVEKSIGSGMLTFVLTSVFITLLAWGTSIGRGISPWPVFVIALVMIPSVAGLFTGYGPYVAFLQQQHAELLAEGLRDAEWTPEYAEIYRVILLFFNLCYIFFSVPLYLALSSSRYLLTEYSTPDDAASLSIKMGSEIAGGLGSIVLFILVSIYQALSVQMEATKIYNEHDPWCRQYENVTGEYGFYCSLLNATSDSWRPAYTPLVFNSTEQHELYGAVSPLVYAYSPYGPNNFTASALFCPALAALPGNATSWKEALGDERFGQGDSLSFDGAAFGALPLSFNDVERRRAVQMAEGDGFNMAFVHAAQGGALSYGMLGALVLTRVARLTFRDAVTLTFTFYEGLAMACTTFLLLGALSLAGGLNVGKGLLLFFGFAFLPFSLWRVCVNISERRAQYGVGADSSGGAADATLNRSGDGESSGSMSIFPNHPRRTSTLTESKSAKSSSISSSSAASCSEGGGGQADTASVVARLQEHIEALERKVAEQEKTNEGLAKRIAEQDAALKDCLAKVSELAKAAGFAEESKGNAKEGKEDQSGDDEEK